MYATEIKVAASTLCSPGVQFLCVFICCIDEASTFGSASPRVPAPVQPVAPRHGMQSVGREERELPLLRFFTRKERGMMYSTGKVARKGGNVD